MIPKSTRTTCNAIQVATYMSVEVEVEVNSQVSLRLHFYFVNKVKFLLGVISFRSISHRVCVFMYIVQGNLRYCCLNLFVQLASFSSSCFKNLLVSSSVSLPFASNLFWAKVTITSGVLIGYIFRNMNV